MRIQPGPRTTLRRCTPGRIGEIVVSLICEIRFRMVDLVVIGLRSTLVIRPSHPRARRTPALDFLGTSAGVCPPAFRVELQVCSPSTQSPSPGQRIGIVEASRRCLVMMNGPGTESYTLGALKPVAVRARAPAPPRSRPFPPQRHLRVGRGVPEVACRVRDSPAHVISSLRRIETFPPRPKPALTLRSTRERRNPRPLHPRRPLRRGRPRWMRSSVRPLR